MNNKAQFIKTFDEECKQFLKAKGYQEVFADGNQWVFLNNSILTFEDLTTQFKGKFKYTDILYT